MDTANQIFQILSGISLLVLSYVGLFIRSKLGELREGQLATRLAIQKETSDMLAQMTASNSQVKSDLQTHQAEDRIHFQTIQRSLDRIEQQRAPLPPTAPITTHAGA